MVFDDLVAIEDRYSSLVNICGEATPQYASLSQFIAQTDPLQKIFWSEQPLENLGTVKVLSKVEGSYYSEETPLYPIEFENFD